MQLVKTENATPAAGLAALASSLDLVLRSLSCFRLLHHSLQGAVDSEGKPVDAAFYRTFWGLQSTFRCVGLRLNAAGCECA